MLGTGGRKMVTEARNATEYTCDICGSVHHADKMVCDIWCYDDGGGYNVAACKGCIQGSRLDRRSTKMVTREKEGGKMKTYTRTRRGKVEYYHRCPGCQAKRICSLVGPSSASPEYKHYTHCCKCGCTLQGTTEA